MDSKVLDLVCSVIQNSSREAPADSVLRETLASQRNFSREESARVSAMVFAYYRWLGWLEHDAPLPEQIDHALDFAARFEDRPEAFSDRELVESSVPAWLSGEMDITPDWARALQSKPVLWLRARCGHGIKLASRLGSSRVFGEGRLGDILEFKAIAICIVRLNFNAVNLSCKTSVLRP